MPHTGLKGAFSILVTYRSVTTSSCSRLELSCEEKRESGNSQDYPDDCEGIAEAHDEGLPLDDFADRHDRLVLCGRRIGDAARQEVVRQVADALPHLVAIERHRLADDVRVLLFALGEHGCKGGGADGAA